MVTIERICTFSLRVIAILTTFSATIVMITSHERVRLNEVSYEAKYSDMPTFKFFVIANAIVCIYGLLVLCLPSKSLLWGLIVALDMVLDVTSSISAALAIGQVEKNGNCFHPGCYNQPAGNIPRTEQLLSACLSFSTTLA
ncbi:hypothetical protein CISIN_1g041640mg, partial [Citrus sinensis]